MSSLGLGWGGELTFVVSDARVAPVLLLSPVVFVCLAQTFTGEARGMNIMTEIQGQDELVITAEHGTVIFLQRLQKISTQVHSVHQER